MLRDYNGQLIVMANLMSLRETIGRLRILGQMMHEFLPTSGEFTFASHTHDPGLPCPESVLWRTLPASLPHWLSTSG